VRIAAATVNGHFTVSVSDPGAEECDWIAAQGLVLPLQERLSRCTAAHWVESTIDHGATFRTELPCVPQLPPGASMSERILLRRGLGGTARHPGRFPFCLRLRCDRRQVAPAHRARLSGAQSNRWASATYEDGAVPPPRYDVNRGLWIADLCRKGSFSPSRPVAKALFRQFALAKGYPPRGAAVAAFAPRWSLSAPLRRLPGDASEAPRLPSTDPPLDTGRRGCRAT